MRVLVAGGAGYIGCVLVRELLARGHAVRVYDRFLFGGEGLADLPDSIELKKGDIRNVDAEDLRGVEAAVNLAGISSDPTAEFKPNVTHDMNVVGAIRLARACREAGVQRYLLASSCSVYDADAPGDEAEVLQDETSEVRPCSAYARSKLEAERELMQLAGDDFSPVALRKGTVFGYSPRMRFDLVINTLVKDALLRGCMTLHAGGETWRPVVEIRDVARAYVACLEAELSSVHGKVLNVVYGNCRVSEMAMRIREALRGVGHATDVRAEYTQPRTRSYRVSGGRLAQTVGCSPTVGIEDSIRNMLTEFKRIGMNDYTNPRYYNTKWLEDLV